MKIFKYFTFGKIITFLVVAWGWYWIYHSYVNPVSQNTVLTLNATAKIWSISDSISAIWSANLIYDQKIRFNQNGTISAIHFKEGDQVKKWQIIAELDKTDLNNSIKQAQIGLNDANVKLQTDLEPPQQKDVLNSQSSISKTQTDLQAAQNNLASLQQQKTNALIDLGNQIKAKQDAIASQKQQLVLAQNAADLLSKQWSQNVNNTSVDAQNAINTAFINSRKYLTDAQSMLTNIDNIFWITNENQYKSVTFINYLSAKDLSLKTSTQSDWNKANILLDKYNSLYDQVSSQWASSSNILDLLSWISSMYNSLINLGNEASNAVNASISSSVFPQSQIDTFYSSMLQVVNQAQTNLSSIQSATVNIQKLTDPTLQKQQNTNDIATAQSKINDINSTISSDNNDLISLNNKLTFTSWDYDNQIKQANFSIQNLQNNLDTNKANLDFIFKWPTKEQIASDKNSIARAQLSLDSAKSQIDKYQIVAPFDGVITQLDFKIWDNLNTQDNQEYVYINNPNLIELTAQLDQIDIGKVKLWQKAVMTFDSFSNTSFDWTVSEIDPTPITTSGVTSYNIKITFDRGKYNIFTWMSAKINIVINSKDNILVVPTSFVTKRRWTSYVTVDDSTGSWQLVEIVPWLSTTNLTEVTSWLQEWDKIIRKIVIPKTAATGSWSTANRSLIPGVGWGGGGWWFGWGTWGGWRWAGGGGWAWRTGG